MIESDGGYVIIGRQDFQNEDLVLEKVDYEGKQIWKHLYGSATGIERGYSVQATSDGGYIGAGRGPDNGLWILRTDSLGDTSWTRTYKLGEPSMPDQGHSIEPASDGCWIITGSVDYAKHAAACFFS